MKKISLSFFVLLIITCFVSACEMPTSGFTLTYDTAGGTEIAPRTGIASGTSVTLPTTAEKIGYFFDAWYSDPEFTEESLLEKKIIVTENTTVYAKFTPRNFKLSLLSTSVVTFNEVTNISCDSLLELPVLVDNQGQYDFVGWGIDGVVYAGTTMPAKDLYLSAIWSNKLFTVTFVPNGGDFLGGFSGVLNNVPSSSRIDLPNVSKEKAHFIGWFLGPEAGATAFTATSVVRGNLTLYAHYQEQVKYTISYESFGGDLPIDYPTYYWSGEGTTLPVPIKDGYEFEGWYISDIFSRDPVFEVSITEAGNLKFYAKWREIKAEYSVTFIDHTGKAVSQTNVAAGSTVAPWTLPTSPSIYFAWFYNDEVFNFGTALDRDIVLYARWAILEDILVDLVPHTAFENFTLLRQIDTSLGKVAISWQSSDPFTLSISGVTNPKRDDCYVILTAFFSFSGSTLTHEFTVCIPKVELRELNGELPVFAYVYSSMSSFTGFSETDLATIDVINYAFARVNADGTVNISGLTKIMDVMQARKSGVRVMLCIGGYGSSCVEFSDAAFTESSRKKFAESVLSIIETYHFDGVDIDWEYPGYYGDQTYRPTEVDRPNYTLLMSKIQTTIKNVNPDYLLTAALPGGKWSYTRYEIGKLDEILDYALIMTYDFHESTKATHHTPLYNSAGTTTGNTASESMVLYNTYGIRKSKLILGIAFYGRVYTLNGDPNVSGIIGSTNIASSGSSITYTLLYNTYLNGNPNAQVIYDQTAQAPFVYIKSEKKIISYDNSASIGQKCRYVINNGYGGVMFWDYGEDKTGLLINAIYNNMK